MYSSALGCPLPAACASCPCPSLCFSGRLSRCACQRWVGTPRDCTAYPSRRIPMAYLPPHAHPSAHAAASSPTRLRPMLAAAQSSPCVWDRPPSCATPDAIAGKARCIAVAGCGRKSAARRRAKARMSRWTWRVQVPGCEQQVPDVLREDEPRTPVFLDRPLAHAEFAVVLARQDQQAGKCKISRGKCDVDLETRVW